MENIREHSGEIHTAQVQIESPSIIRQWIENEEVVLVDVREPNEYAAAHIAEANLIPLSQFDPALIPDDPSKKLVVHCQSGQRCAVASALIVASGFPREFFRMEGGLKQWIAEGGAVESEQT